MGGADITPEMFAKAAIKGTTAEFSNVEFLLEEIEYLSYAGSPVGVIIVNCVMNLAPPKEQVFRKA